jgi:hypothetical protein
MKSILLDLLRKNLREEVKKIFLLLSLKKKKSPDNGALGNRLTLLNSITNLKLLSAKENLRASMLEEFFFLKMKITRKCS